MPTHMQQTANAVLDAMDEVRVSAIMHVLNAKNEARVSVIMDLIEGQYLKLDLSKTLRENVLFYCDVVQMKNTHLWIDDYVTFSTKTLADLIDTKPAKAEPEEPEKFFTRDY